MLVHPIKEPKLCYPSLNLGRASSFSYKLGEKQNCPGLLVAPSESHEIRMVFIQVGSHKPQGYPTSSKMWETKRNPQFTTLLKFTKKGIREGEMTPPTFFALGRVLTVSEIRVHTVDILQNTEEFME